MCWWRAAHALGASWGGVLWKTSHGGMKSLARKMTMVDECAIGPRAHMLALPGTSDMWHEAVLMPLADPLVGLLAV